MSSGSMDFELRLWSDIQEQFEGGGLLIGNGASRAVWDGFRYESLYDEAQSHDLEHHLSAADRTIFESLGTHNFETVLSALRTARLVGHALKQDVSAIVERYENVKTSLIDAVHGRHVKYEDVSPRTLKAIRAELLKYDFVYSTNYDLLLYWAIMSEDDRYRFIDFLWSDGFDITNTEVFRKATKVLYLHGGLLLARQPSGRTVKLKWQPGSSILDQFSTASPSDDVPLFVSEGTSEDKEAAIRSSDYLTFALEQFAAHRGRLVVFGHSLGKNDSHLVRAMRRWEQRPIAIAIRPGTERERRERISPFLEGLSTTRPIFFDATMHPLGAKTLEVTLGK